MQVLALSINLFVDYYRVSQRPHKAYPVELAQFHSADYVEFLHRITPDTQHLFSNELARCMTLGYVYIVIFCLYVCIDCSCYELQHKKVK